MATVRAFNHIVHRRHTIVCTIPNVFALYNCRIIPHSRQNVSYSTKKALSKAETEETENKVQVGYTEVVTEGVKNVSYLGIVLAAVGLTGFLAYIVFKELFSSNSPNRIYNWAVNKCLGSNEVIDALGAPVKAYGEESRRGRRGHASHSFYIRDGRKYMRMQFYLKGIRRTAVVSLEMQENDSGNYVCRYLYVMVNDILKRVIKIEDNTQPAPVQSFDTELELA